MSIDIVIVNWNAGKLLSDCIESINVYGKPFVSRVVVVDNCSSDDSVNFLIRSNDVDLIQLEENIGFGRACNLGAKHCKSKYILFLNPDARLYKDTLEIVLNFMNDIENSNVGICGVQLEDGDGNIARSNSRFPSLKGLLSHAIGLTKLIPHLGDPMSEWDHSSTQKVDQIMGAFFFVRNNLYNKLSGFDERFFVYFEEVDFSKRAKNLGWSSVYLANAKAFHFGGGVSRQVKARRLFYSLRSRIQYIFKHLNLIEVTLILLVTIIIEPITRLAFSFFNRSSQALGETLIAYFMLYKWLVLYPFKK